jgi:hypothetical protein
MHKSNYNFVADKVLGDEAELLVLGMVQKIFPKAYRVDKYHPEYDIMIPELDKTIEVKNDLRAAATGNLAIECSKKSGLPSGIMISEADFWVILADNEILLMGKDALKNYIGNNKFRKVWGGDRNAAEMYLIPLEKIKQQDFTYKIG